MHELLRTYLDAGVEGLFQTLTDLFLVSINECLDSRLAYCHQSKGRRQATSSSWKSFTYGVNVPVAALQSMGDGSLDLAWL